MGDMPPRLVLIENDDKGGVRSHPEVVDAAADVLRAWRLSPMGAPIAIEQQAPDLAHALQRLSQAWPK